MTLGTLDTLESVSIKPSVRLNQAAAALEAMDKPGLIAQVSPTP